MKFFKILSFAALGVGAVAAAPFTGGGSILGAASLAGSLAGAGTIAAAVGAGAAGGAAGYALSRKEEEDQDEENRKSRKEGKSAGELLASQKYEKKIADADKRLREFEEKFQSVEKSSSEYSQMCNQIVAMFAIGVAVAHCDGEYSEAEQKEIANFIGGVMGSALPSSLKAEIVKLEENPPSVQLAFAMAADAMLDLKVIDAIILQVAMADGEIGPDEKLFIKKWQKQARQLAA